MKHARPDFIFIPHIDLKVAQPGRECKMVTEINVEGVGVVRQLNVWQIMRAKRVRGENRKLIAPALAAGMTIQQFKKLPIEKRRDVVRAYMELISPTNV
jgi:hypothetical protein